MKKVLLVVMLMLVILSITGCGNGQVHKVDGILESKTFYSNSDNIFVIKDSYGKETILKSNSSYIAHWAHIGDKVEVDYNDNYTIVNIKAYK